MSHKKANWNYIKFQVVNHNITSNKTETLKIEREKSSNKISPSSGTFHHENYWTLKAQKMGLFQIQNCNCGVSLGDNMSTQFKNVFPIQFYWF